MPRMLTIRQAAEQLGRPVATLYDWRYKGIGPRSAKVGGRVMYRAEDLDAWLEAQFESAVGDSLETA